MLYRLAPPFPFSLPGMRDEDRQTRSRLMRLFEQQGRQPRHDLGQNFLVDLNLHDLIVKHASLSSSDVVLEVGTGTGGLTTALADHAGHVISVEFDEHLHGHAKHLLAGRNNLTLIHGDALANKSTIAPNVIAAIHSALASVKEQERAAFPDDAAGEISADDADNPWVLKPRETTLKLVANLPYNIATPLMSNLVASDLPWSLMVVTIQFELAERMLAKPGTRDYSALTVWLQAQSQMKLIRKLPPNVFWPPPKVDSAVLRVERDEAAQSRIANREWLHGFLRDVFTQRRKRLLGVLTGMLATKKSGSGHPTAVEMPREQIETLLRELGLDENARAEQVAPEVLVELVNRLETAQSKSGSTDNHAPVVEKNHGHVL